MSQLAQGVYGKTVKFWFKSGSNLLEVCNKIAWFQFGSVFPLSVFSLPFLIDFFFFYSRRPHVSVCHSSHLFRVVKAPHGILTATLWANVGSRISHSGSGESATTAILWDRVSAFLGDGYRLGIWLWSVFVSDQLKLPLFCSYHWAEVIHAGVEIVAWPT